MSSPLNIWDEKEQKYVPLPCLKGEKGDKGDPAVTDQTYNPTSENAQSGKAVAEAVAQSGGGTVDDWEQLIDVTTQEDASSFSFTFKDVKELIVMISGIATHARVNFYSHGMTNFYHYYFLTANKFVSNYMYIRRRLGGMRYVESGSVSSEQPDLIRSYELVGETPYGRLVSSTNDMVNDLRFGLNSQEVLKSGARIQIFGR